MSVERPESQRPEPERPEPDRGEAVDLADLPQLMQCLPRDRIGRPIPWFVDISGGTVNVDFRVPRMNAVPLAVVERRCWVCGHVLMRHWRCTFVIGPMCAINRISAEPPSHHGCAEWSAKHCPFLSHPQMVRRERGMPDPGSTPGVMLTRNPGAVLLWTARGWSPLQVEGGTLFDIGEPREVSWWCRGRAATRQEVLAAMDSGMPDLSTLVADQEGPQGVADLHRRYLQALELIPA